jgi:hypothetical protein
MSAGPLVRRCVPVHRLAEPQLQRQDPVGQVEQAGPGRLVSAGLPRGLVDLLGLGDERVDVGLQLAGQPGEQVVTDAAVLALSPREADADRVRPQRADQQPSGQAQVARVLQRVMRSLAQAVRHGGQAAAGGAQARVPEGDFPGGTTRKGTPPSRSGLG